MLLKEQFYLHRIIVNRKVINDLYGIINRLVTYVRYLQRLSRAMCGQEKENEKEYRNNNIIPSQVLPFGICFQFLNSIQDIWKIHLYDLT